jgi:homoserine kinase
VNSDHVQGRMNSFVDTPVRVSVPATSANLGPGYDALGLALGLRDTVTVQVADHGVDVQVTGEGEDSLPRDDSHLVVRAVRRGFAAMGLRAPGLRLRCDNTIPQARGMGSSSAAIVAGVLAASGLVAGGTLLMDEQAVYALAADLEGHPDNVAPALFGGCTIAYTTADGVRAATVAVDPRIQTTVFVPPYAMETAAARRMLPTTVPHADAASNAGRAALLVAALSGQPELLLDATEDRLHQRQRGPAMPESLRLVDELRARGVPAVISGAGPAVLAFSAAGEKALGVRAPDGWAVRRLPVDHGARVELLGASRG